MKSVAILGKRGYAAMVTGKGFKKKTIRNGFRSSQGPRQKPVRISKPRRIPSRVKNQKKTNFCHSSAKVFWGVIDHGGEGLTPRLKKPSDTPPKTDMKGGQTVYRRR